MENTQTSEKNGSSKIGIIAGIAIALIAVLILTNGFGLFTGKVVDPTNTLSIGNSPVLGDANAPVTMYIFSDFSCPFCAAAEGYNEQVISALKSRDSSWTAPLPEIKKKYVETGKVKLVFKYYPGHGSGKPAHLIAWCLNEQGKFWQFGELAFANQASTNDFEAMKSLAKQTGADMTALQACLDSGKYNTQFEKDISLAKANNIRGTPTFFINGQEISGAASFSEFDKAIQAALK